MPTKKKKGWLRIPDCLRPSRKTFRFDDVDHDPSVWDAPNLEPQDKRRIKYAWLVLHDGRLSHEDIGEEFVTIMEDRYSKFIPYWWSLFLSIHNETQNANANWIEKRNNDENNNVLTSACLAKQNTGNTFVFPQKKGCVFSFINRGIYVGISEKSCPFRKETLACDSKGDTIKEFDVNMNKEDGSIQHSDVESVNEDDEDSVLGDEIWDAESHKHQLGKRFHEEISEMREEFKVHTLKIFESFDRFVKLIDDSQSFMELGFEMRNYHRNFKGSKKGHYRIVCQCVEDTLVSVMDPKIYRKRIRESMIKFLELIYYNTTFQMDNGPIDLDYRFQ